MKKIAWILVLTLLLACLTACGGGKTELDKAFTTINVDGGLKIIDYNGNHTTLEIPSTIGKKTVVEIGDEAFAQSYLLTEIVIPDPVRVIGDHAFRGCLALEKIVIPDSVKEIGDFAIATPFLEALHALTPTEETVPKISDDVLELGGGDYPVDRGTFWVEADGKIYRVNRDYDEVCLVETHFGEGKVLEMTAEFAKLLQNAWYYAPLDSWIGTYKDGDEKIELRNAFSAPSTVLISVKEIYLDKADRTDNNKIVVELISALDQTVYVSSFSQQSDDNLGSGDSETVELKAGVPVTVELSFFGFSYGYWVTLRADNTMVEITINP